MEGITGSWGELFGVFLAGARGGYLRLERLHLVVYAGKVFARAGHAGVLGPDEAGVGRYRLSHALDRPGQLRRELAAHDLGELRAQRLGLLPELPAGLAAAVGQDKEPQAGEEERRERHGHVHGGGHGHRGHDSPETQGADLGGDRLGDGPLQGERYLLRFPIPIVVSDDRRRVAADRTKHLAAVVLEVVADVADQVLVVLRLPAAVHVCDDAPPLLQVPVDHPVDKLPDAIVDQGLRVGNDLALETVLDLLAPDQLADVADPDVSLEPFVAPLVHLVNYVLDLRHPGLEVAVHVLYEDLELRLDVLGGPEIFLEQVQALLDRAPVAPG